jgi:predicted ABC-type exoprotein transport system permease subunit
MIGPRMNIGTTHAPLILLIATPIVVAVTGVGMVPVLICMLFILFFNIQLNLRSLRQPEKYQLESIAASHYVEVRAG